MQTRLFELPTKALPDYAEKPSVSAIQIKKNSSLMVATAFSTPLLMELRFNKDFSKMENVMDQQLSRDLGADAVAILNGLKSSSTGDTALSVLHPGSIANFI